LLALDVPGAFEKHRFETQRWLVLTKLAVVNLFVFEQAWYGLRWFASI